MEKFWVAHSPKDMVDIAREILSELVKNDIWVVGLVGELGAGKTTLAQAIASVIGVGGQVHSPTFVLQKKYPIENLVFPMIKHLVHIDTYRAENIEELKILELEKLFMEQGNLTLIEWPEILRDILPNNSVIINIAEVNDGRREIKMLLTKQQDRPDTDY